MTQNTPALRFPEFSQSPPWETKKLEEVSTICSQKISKEHLDDNIFISTQDFLPEFTGVQLNSKIESSVNVSHFKTGDVLLSNIRPYLKKGWVANCDGGASNDVIIFRNGQNVNPKYFASLILSDLFIDYVMKGAKGVKMPRGDQALMLKFSFPLPTLPEQQKIADCLSSLDDLIVAQSDQIAALKDYKKGLLQELFPAEGETSPRRRFPEFSQSPPWETKKLGEVCDVRDGTHESPIYLNSGVKFITSKNLLPSGNLDLINVNYISKEDAENYNMRSKVNVDDILFGMIGTIGRPVKVKNDDFCIKNMALIKKTSLIDQTFVLYFLSSDMFNAQLTNDSVGNSQKFIALNNLRNTIIHFPYFLEQQKIAKFLSSLDEQITAATEKLETLKSHKKGLMQQLFPSTLELT